MKYLEIKNVLLLLKLAALGSAGFIKREENCSCTVNESSRVDCGYNGINKSQCVNKGCCWAESKTNGIPWCFYTAGGGLTSDCQSSNSCSVSESSRKDCGYPGINQSQCVSKGCCWAESSTNGIPWCFYSNDSTTTTTTTTTTTESTTSKVTTTPVVSGSCAVEESSRAECGYYGITAQECTNSGCCWAESKTNGVPWCFKSNGPTVTTPAVTTPPSTTTTPVPTIVPGEGITIRFYKPSSWNKLNLWAWKDDQTNVYGSVWPGKEITDLGNGWFSYTFDKSITSVNLLFNDGTVQTNDIEKVTTSTCFKLVGSSVVTTVDCGIDNLGMCQADAAERKQCGGNGISKDKCMEQNCCYSELEGSASCFYPVGANTNNRAGSCAIDNLISRTQCGESLSITKKECTKLGCCWNESKDENFPSCFNHAQNVPTCHVDVEARSACGYAGISADECHNKYGCCYDESGLSQETFCFYKAVQGSSGTCVKYEVTDLEETDSGITSTLDLGGASCQKYDIDIQTLSFTATFETNSRLHIKIAPTDIENYPHNTDMPAAAYPETPENEEVTDPEYSFEITEGAEFNIIVKRKDGTVIFDTTKHDFVFEQQYLELTTSLRTDANIYGFGEVVSSFKRNTSSTRQALFNLDVACPKDQNVYGSHPFFIEIEEDGRAHGVFLRNSHGMDFVLEPGKLSYQINGGNFDLFFFMGPTVEDVISQYYKVIGQPAFLPYWSLGWHQCRYGYPNIDYVEYVVKKYKELNIPLDTMWIDIDYMDAYKDFTYDPVNYPIPRVKSFVDNLHRNHQSYINMIDPAISTDEDYDSFKRGVEADIFIKDAQDNLFRGQVWPGETAFPDWHHPGVLDYWRNEIKLFKDMAMTDGNWIDMNEAANFCNGACKGSTTEKPFVMGEFNPNSPPFGINDNKSNKTPLKFKNLNMDAKYYGGLIEYDIHNIYGHMESIVTYKALLDIDPVKRPFLLSRSTFSGTGKYAAHWLGDNHSTWEYLYLSIPGMMNFQMFGVPMVGSDICGFNGDASEELCARWMELGAFYPFARNHNAKGTKSQEPFEWDSVTEASRKALNIRYQILPYWYTLLVRTHTDSGMMIVPLAFEWPTDKTALEDDKQFLVGKGLLITPVLNQGATSVEGYFPEGKWYDWYTNESFVSSGMTKVLSAPLTHIPIHVRGGHIIPTQGPALTVYENRQKPFGLIVALDNENKATGEIYLDDGSSIDIAGKKTEIKYSVEGNTLTATGSYNYTENQSLSSIKILGVSSSPSKINVNGSTSNATVKFSNGTLEISNLNISMNEDFTLSWA